MAESKCFIELEQTIENGLSVPANVKALETYVKNRLGVNAEILASPSIDNRPMTSASEDQGIIFSTTGLSRQQVKEVLTRTTNKDVKAGWNLWQQEHYLAFTMSIRYFLKKKNDKMAELLGIFYTVLIYSALYTKYFQIGVKKEVMAYTLSNMSNKFDIKRIGSLMGTLRKIYEGNLQNSKARLLKYDDDSIFVFQRDLRTRINTFIQNIAKVYYKNYEEGNFLNEDRSIDENEEGKEYQVERSSDSAAVYQAADSYEIWFNSNRLNERLIRTISSMTPEISASKLSSVLNAVKADKKDRVRIIVRCMLGLLLEVQHDNSLKAIHSPNFPIFCVRILSKSNTKNPNILTVKTTVDSLLNDFCDTFRNTKREASKINYRKALVLYIAMSLQIQRK